MMKTAVMTAAVMLLAACSAKRESAHKADYETERKIALRGGAEKTVKSLSEMNVEIEIEKPTLTLKTDPSTSIIEGERLTIREKSSGMEAVRASVEAEGAAESRAEGATAERRSNHFESSGWKRVLVWLTGAICIIAYIKRKKMQAK